MRSSFVVSTLFLFFRYSQAQCINDCMVNGVRRGLCRGPNWTCDCHEGWGSGDCSERVCPKASAWFDEAQGTDNAHNLAECSNMGICDRTTGLCTCRQGFSGLACERMDCPVNSNGGSCSGHGRCMTMGEYAAHQDDYKSFYSVTYTQWDANRIFGCVCDEGFTGYDCSLRTCPSGDDPGSPIALLDEIQYIDCLCQTGCSGSFRLSFRSDLTVSIAHDADAAAIQTALNGLRRLTGVVVTLSGGTTVCDNDGAAAKIQFAQNPGNLPAMVVVSDLTSSGGTPSISIKAGGASSAYGGANSQDGNRENFECNHRGTCDRTTGLCSCDPGYTSSNGGGGTGGTALNNGTKGDCGLPLWDTVTNCPAVDNVLCSGHGTCLNSTNAAGSETYQCSCYSGYTGHNCAKIACPTGTAWFDEATSSSGARTDAHQTAVCSNAGICDDTTGVCTCAAHLGGSACQTILCPGASQDSGSSDTSSSPAPAPTDGSTGGVCSGKGTCKTISALALLAKNEFGNSLGYTYGGSGTLATWDKDSVNGCQCDQRSYHGPFIGDATDHYGYDCSQIQCPYGDDPGTEGGVHEKQTIYCKADGGTFTLSFYGYTTTSIAYNANAATVEAALEALDSIHVLYGVGVEVSIQSGGASVCTASGAYTDITFKQNLGDVPMLVLTTSSLTLASGSVETKMIENMKGTMENVECSLRGKCYPTYGLCSCYIYHASSDGSGNGGSRADCGHRNIFQKTHLYPVVTA